MSIVIKKILSERHDKTLCRVQHGLNTFNALIYGQATDVEKFVFSELIVEMSFDRIVEAKVIPGFDDNDSVISGMDEMVNISGRIHAIFESEEKVYDIYVRNGPEYLCVSESEWSITPEENTGIQVTVEGLCFYPTKT